MITKVHREIDKLCLNSLKRPRLAKQLKTVWSEETAKHAHEETNSNAMMGGETEGKKWIGLTTGVRDETLPGKWAEGRITKFTGDTSSEDHLWEVEWEHNPTPFLYTYVGLKAIVKEKHWIEPTPLSNAKPAEQIVNQREQNRIKQLCSAGFNALWKGLFPNVWMLILEEAGIDKRLATKGTTNLREILLQGQHDIWKRRNDLHHGNMLQPEDKANIEQIFRVLQKLRLSTHEDTAESVCNMPASKRKRWCMRQKDRAKRAQAQFDEEDEKEKIRRTHLEVTIPNRKPPPDNATKVQSDVRSIFAAPGKRKMSAREDTTIPTFPTKTKSPETVRKKQRDKQRNEEPPTEYASGKRKWNAKALEHRRKVKKFAGKRAVQKKRHSKRNAETMKLTPSRETLRKKLRERGEDQAGDQDTTDISAGTARDRKPPIAQETPVDMHREQATETQRADTDTLRADLQMFNTAADMVGD